jgi:hypothetical protein
MSLTQEEQRKIINHGVHDVVNATCGVRVNVELIQMKLEDGPLDKEWLLHRLQRIIDASRRADTAVDYIYTKFKEART